MNHPVKISQTIADPFLASLSDPSELFMAVNTGSNHIEHGCEIVNSYIFWLCLNSEV